MLAPWYHEGQRNRSVRSIDLAHALRLAVLYKYGGIATDFNMLWFKRVDIRKFGNNFVGIESGSPPGNGSNAKCHGVT